MKEKREKKDTNSRITSVIVTTLLVFGMMGIISGLILVIAVSGSEDDNGVTEAGIAIFWMGVIFIIPYIVNKVRKRRMNKQEWLKTPEGKRAIETKKMKKTLLHLKKQSMIKYSTYEKWMKELDEKGIDAFSSETKKYLSSLEKREKNRQHNSPQKSDNCNEEAIIDKLTIIEMIDEE